MAITVTNLGSSAAPDFENNADQASYDSASWTPPTCDLILAWVYNTKATTLGNEPTMTGNGLTWAKQISVGTDPGAQTHRLTVFAADATGGASAGVTTVSFGGQTQSSIIVQFVRVDGVDLTGGVAGAIIQQPTNSSNSATSLAVNLSAAGNSNNRFFYGIGHGTGEVHTPEAGWDELDDMGGTSPGHGLSNGWDADSVADTSPSASWTTAGAACGIAIEVVAGASGTAFTYTATDTLGLTDAISIARGFGKTIADALGLTDSNSNARTLDRTITNTVGFTDLISRAVNKVISISDSLGLTDALIKSIGYVKTISDNLGLTDLINAVVVTAQHYTVTITDTLGLTDIVQSFFVHISRDFLRGKRRLLEALRGKRALEDDLVGTKTGESLDGKI